MKRLAILAIAVVSVTGTPAVAGAESGTARNAEASARYAMLQSCPKKDYRVPCGSWTVVLRDGKKVVLEDAQVFQVTGNKVDKESSLPIHLSGDGRRAVYFRKADRQLVVRDLSTNKVIALPAKAAKVPAGMNMSDVGTFLSGDGAVLVIDYLEEAARRESLIVDVASGDVRTFKGNESVDSVSARGEYVLTSRYTSENTWTYTAYDRAGNAVNSQVVPQIVANNSPVALADDGTTMAVVVSGIAGTSLRLYDLANDTVGGKIDVSVPKREVVQHVQWDSGDRLTLRTFHDVADYTATQNASWEVSAGTGVTKRTDSFTIKSKVWDYRLPGD
ncbi:hypothetical protein Aph01nite_62620 [Acrocarpospora phusangensis]|uniref:Lipoprotein LpqB beta-propeller domain-containing protein n=1 Tax=Acrocarpospora phusangensis TaxID=1070424 RepID=A0A919QFF5_9ACTN|nr:hypothetical protein [Acrocarpospora phusangensis]GIH27952.1 hypothetical protein Aph01nite_62620 [Acrocarpospora phusangensis]